MPSSSSRVETDAGRQGRRKEAGEEGGSTGKLCLAATSTSKAVKRGADGVVDWEAFVARQMLTFLA